MKYIARHAPAFAACAACVALIACAAMMGMMKCGAGQPEDIKDGVRGTLPTFSIVIIAPASRVRETAALLSAAREADSRWPGDDRVRVAMVAHGADAHRPDSPQEPESRGTPAPMKGGARQAEVVDDATWLTDVAHASDLASAIDAAADVADAHCTLRHILVFVDSTSHDEKSVRAAADRAIEARRADTVNAIAIRGPDGAGPTRAWAGRTLANSHIKFPDGWSTSGVPEWERNLAIIAQVNGWDDQCLGTNDVTMSEMVARFMKRLTRHFGDYDGDGVVDVNFDCQNTSQPPTGDDWDAFLAGVQGQSIFADWNFDDEFDGNRGPPTFGTSVFGIDFSKFITGAIGGCP